MIDPNAPAFPWTDPADTPYQPGPSCGLTIRETIAKDIMSRISSAPSGDDLAIPLEVLGRSYAEIAIAYTDALLAELNKSEDRP